MLFAENVPRPRLAKAFAGRERKLPHPSMGHSALECLNFMAPAGHTTERPGVSVWRLGGLTFWQLAKNVVHVAAEADLVDHASGLAFSFLLALFPLLLFMLALFGLFASRSSELQTSLLSYFADFLPPSAFQLLNDTTNELAKSSTGGKLTFGLVLALWFGSGGISSMISTLNAAYSVRESRSWLRMRAIALGLTVAISILLLAALFILLAGGHFVDWIGLRLNLGSTVVILWKTMQWIAAAVFAIVSFWMIYYCGPSFGKRHWYWGMPGSIFGAVLWLAASAGFRLYLHFFNTYTATYASLGAVMILLVWLYVTGLAFLIGGEINAEIEHAATGGEFRKRDASARV
jgi:membrane protein